MGKVPKRLQPILWSTDVNLLDLDKHKNYIIHQVLIYGSLDDIHWLFKTYGKREIINVFLYHPVKIYPRFIFSFIKNFILNLKDKKITEEKYVTTISGQIKPRAARSI